MRGSTTANGLPPEVGEQTKTLRHAACMAIAVLATYAGACPGAGAPAYPAKPIRIVVGTAAGGGIDTVARKVGGKLSDSLGQPVLVDNRPGGAQRIATDAVAKAPPDGYTLMCISSTHAIIPSLFKDLPFDPVRDFAPVTMLAWGPNLLVVHPSLPVRSLKEFVAFARSRPGQLNYGSSGNGSLGNLGMELLKTMTGIDLVHIPYKGAAPALTALLSGEIAVEITQIITVLPQVRAGRLRAIGITSAQRSTALPDVPTISEAGAPGFQGSSWFGIVAPARTPPEIVTRLNEALVRIMNTPDIRNDFSREGAIPVGDNPAEFAATIKAEIAKWGKVAKASGITPE